MRIKLRLSHSYALVYNICLLGLALVAIPASALRDQSMAGDDAGAVVAYDFPNSAATSLSDSSGIAPALNLSVSTAGNLPTGTGIPIRNNFAIQNGVLIMNPKPNGAPDNSDLGYQSAQRHRTVFVSDVPAAKLNACTSGFTVQAFLRPWFPFQGSNNGNLIVGLTNSEGLASAVEPNFGLYQSGMSGSEAITLKVRTGNNVAASQSSIASAFYSVREGENMGKWTEVIATQEPGGVMTVYVNRIPRSSITAPKALFAAGAKLVIGNEMIPITVDAAGVAQVGQQRNWSGEIAHLAIYCHGFTRTEILGAIMENKSHAEIVRPETTVVVDAVRQDARRLVERLVGGVMPIDHPMVLRVDQKLRAGDRLGAVKIVTGDKASGEVGHSDFLNVVVKQMAMEMSNREETIRAPFNDFAASFIGITRDERSAKELLTQDFYYMADPAKAKVPSDIYKDMVISNNHYDTLEKDGWDLGKVLIRVQGQQIAVDNLGKLSPNPDPAGVLTSRAFMAAHATAGTNRRIVEYTFREFMCIHMNEMADTSASAARIGRDVDRFPGGDPVKFETSCKGCHTVMDGFRGAFAKFDFSTRTVNGTAFNYVSNSQINTSGPFALTNKEVDKYGTILKMNHNETVFPNGYTIIDDTFMNNAVGATNRTTFGWTGSNKAGGTGVNQFGQMIADSTRFSQCMAKRVFHSVCMPNFTDDSKVSTAINELATKFRSSGYKLRSLFQETAASPACAQYMGR